MPAGGAITSVTVVVRVSVPLVPVSVIVYVPATAVAAVAHVNVLEPVAAIGLVPNEYVTPAIAGEAASVTLPVKPPVAVLVTVYVAEPPTVTVLLAGVAASVKPGSGGALMTSCIVVVRESAPLVPVTVTV